MTTDHPAGYASHSTAAAASKGVSSSSTIIRVPGNSSSSSSYLRSGLNKPQAQLLTSSTRTTASTAAARSSSASPERLRRTSASPGGLDTVLERRVLSPGPEPSAVYKGRFSFRLQTAPADMSVAAQLATAAAAAASRQLRKDTSSGYAARTASQGLRVVHGAGAARAGSSGKGRALSSSNSSGRGDSGDYASGLSTLKRVCQTQRTMVPSLAEQLERASRQLEALTSAKRPKANAARDSQFEQPRDRSHMSLAKSHFGVPSGGSYSHLASRSSSKPSSAALRSVSAERVRGSYGHAERSRDRSLPSAYSRRSVGVGGSECSSLDPGSVEAAWKLQAAAEVARLQYKNSRSSPSSRLSSRYAGTHQ